MNIRISRHASRRLKLYKMDVGVIDTIIQQASHDPGRHEIVHEISGFRYPIKIVYTVEGAEVTLITAFPLKRGKES